MPKKSITFALAAFAIAASACSSSGSSNSQKISQCKSGCDQMKFFDCSTADELSRCYDDCNSAAPTQVDKFNGCAGSSICDPACRGLIEPSGGGSSSGGGGGVAASDCDTACDKIIECNLAPVSAKDQCLSYCEEQGYQYQIDCVNNNACGDIQARCGSTGGGGTVGEGDAGTTNFDEEQCKSACDSLHAESCLDAAGFSTCESKCTSITDSSRSTFISCFNSAGGGGGGTGSDCVNADGLDCYNVFAQ